jgi:putative acyl-CoA dehydrogenase
MEFYQDAPELKNSFSSDLHLKAHLERVFPEEIRSNIFPHLKHVGELAVSDWLKWSVQAQKVCPELIHFDVWGHRIDEIRMPQEWKNLEAAAATEGIVACGYERKFGEYSRVYQAALLYLFHPSSAFVSCPLAMTDGAARAIELYGDQDLKTRAFKHLTSRDPKTFWTSGQWMTEKTGGSDVSETSTIAKKLSQETLGAADFGWSLYGTKWFTSATTSKMAMLLARPEGAEAGSRGLSLFYTETRDAHERLQNIEILRLKDKLGTRAMPTAELKLIGTPARLVGGEGHGVRKISSLFNITRVYNSICAIGHMRRALDLAQSYSRKRKVFGKYLIDHALHKFNLDRLEQEFCKSFDLTFYVAHLLGKDECGTATESERILLRSLTPIVKLFTAKRCMEVVSEVVEIFGGVGYIEDSGLPTLLRDAQVFSIWEGTTNVLALDFLRALQKENAAPVLIEKIQKDFAARFKDPKALNLLKELKATLQKVESGELNAESLEIESRPLSFLIAEIFARGLSYSS